MKFIIDHDLHIHSQISTCSRDPEQNNERILQYAIDNGFNTICLTDHLWDSDIEGADCWYKPQNYDHIAQAKPLPQAEGVRFLFGCEVELDKYFTLGLSPEKYDLFDFIIIPTTHLHMKGMTISEEDAATPEGRAKVWLQRLEAVLNMDLPFKKVGIAHLTTTLIAPTKEEYWQAMDMLPEDELVRLFTKAANLGVGIELNATSLHFDDEDADRALRVFKIAKRCGCKFYCGSDAHHPERFEVVIPRLERVVDYLGLTEDDKFRI